MRKYPLIIFSFLLSLGLLTHYSPSAVAAPSPEKENLGLGFVVGTPTALSMRYNLAPKKAFDAQVAFVARHYVLVYGDYLVPFAGWLGFRDKLLPYVGVGLISVSALKKDHDRDGYFDRRDDWYAIALRVPFGLEWRWETVPLGLGAEVSPGIVVLPSTTGILQIGLTLRYYL